MSEIPRMDVERVPRRRMLLGAIVCSAIFVAGCGKRQWEIVAENKSSTACDVFVAMGADGASRASVAGLKPGERVSLVVGDFPTRLRAIRITRDGKDETTELDSGLPLGECFAITVEADGKVSTAMTAR